jgi:uncharacterized protein YbjT (DUF2867 family)
VRHLLVVASVGIHIFDALAAIGAAGAVEEIWPRADRQHCAVHRLRNLLAKLPKSEQDRTRFNYWSALIDATSVKDGKLRLQPDSGYLRAKVAQEAEIEAGAVPYTILRATQFFEFLSQIVEAGAEGDSVRLSTGLIQFVAADDVAATVAELAIGAPVGERVELGGPEALGIDAWARRLFAATGDNRAVIADPHARYYGTELHGGELTPGAGARIGEVDFDPWFAANQQEAR